MNRLLSLMKGTCGLAAVLVLTAQPAAAGCMKRHPLLGVDVRSSNCPAPKQKSVRRTRSARAAAVAARQASKLKTPAKETAKVAPVALTEIEELQSLLATVGYYDTDPQAIDGKMNAPTQRAVARFNRMVNLPATASAQDTLNVLRRLSGKATAGES